MHIFRTNIDIEKNEIKNLRLGNQIAFPSVITADKGFVFFHSGVNKFYGWNGTSWLDLASAGSSYVLPTASTITLGGVKIDGTTITIDGSGVISSSGGGVSDFLSLTDTPANYTGSAYKIPRVNVGETAMEFYLPPIKAEDQGNGIGYALANRDETKFTTLGSKAFDLTFYDTGIRTDYGVGCDAGFSHGYENRLPLIGGEFGGHVAFGYENYVAGYYGNIAMGGKNSLNSGYTCMQVGYQNIGNWSNSIGMGYQFGTNNTSSAYFNVSTGSGLTNNWVGATVVGSANLIDAAGATAANRPMFIVGIGTLSTGGGTVGAPLVRKDGFMVRLNGEILMPNTTIAVINAETTGKQAVTKEWITAQGYSTSPYLVYTAILTQTGTSAPVPTVLRNTIGAITWSYTSTGRYTATLAGAFTASKTVVFVTMDAQTSGSNNIIKGNQQDVNGVTVETMNSGVVTNGIMQKASIEIRVYP